MLEISLPDSETIWNRAHGKQRLDGEHMKKALRLFILIFMLD